MKKMTLLGLSLILSVALTACGETASTSGSTEQSNVLAETDASQEMPEMVNISAEE